MHYSRSLYYGLFVLYIFLLSQAITTTSSSSVSGLRSESSISSTTAKADSSSTTYTTAASHTTSSNSQSTSNLRFDLRARIPPPPPIRGTSSSTTSTSSSTHTSSTTTRSTTSTVTSSGISSNSHTSSTTTRSITSNITSSSISSSSHTSSTSTGSTTSTFVSSSTRTTTTTTSTISQTTSTVSSTPSSTRTTQTSSLTTLTTSKTGLSSSTNSAKNSASSVLATLQSTTAATSTYASSTQTSTTTSTSHASTATSNSTASGNSTQSTFLVLARDTSSAYSAYSGLNAYGIPYEVLIVPSAGVTLPNLTSNGVGNYGGIVILSEVAYSYGGSIGFASALTSAQFASLYAYQQNYGVRMVRLDVYPDSTFGTTVVSGGCCSSTQEQYISISDSSAFPLAGVKTGANMSTVGLYHYPASITDASMATAFAQFGTTDGYTSTSTAGVINTIDGRQQMVFFISFGTDWSTTSNFLQHVWIQWATRGLYAGYRRVYLETQVDDMFLSSSIYGGNGTTFRVRTGDLDAIKTWVPTLNAKLSSGSSYFVEIGHNGNGNIGYSYNADATGQLCGIGPIFYTAPAAPALEFQKPLGTGSDLWPANETATTYPYTAACLNNDPLKVWWATAANRDVFAHVSHTFTHESEDNATFYDIFNEISWNQAWLKQSTIDQAAMYSSYGLIPPAITGVHNGDALRAWTVRGLKNAVGDNSRSVLLNTENEHWPLITTVADNGYDGVQITPRWSTNIYYNCDRANCTVAEWIATASGSGDINSLLSAEKSSATRHLLGLRHDPFMFHQANLRQTDVDSVTINGVTSQLSLLQMWVETVVQEMVRIVNWPILSLKHDDIATSFANRMARDQCGYTMSYILDVTSKTITGVTVSTTDNTCSAAVPVTVPGSVTSTQGFTTEQIGNDPLTIWVTTFPTTFTLTTPISWT